MRITVSEEYIGERLDKVVAQLFPEYSRSALAKLIDMQSVLVNDKAQKSKYKLRPGDRISVDSSHLDSEPETIDLPVVYEDDDVVVINKPAGILTHSKGNFNKEGTVATFLKNHVTGVILSEVERSAINNQSDLSMGTQDDKNDDFWNSNRAGIVHRLDRGTSGIIICAKNKTTQDYLQGQFSKRNVKKTYIAVISGELSEPEGIIDVPIERNPKKPAAFRIGINGKSAQTHFKTLLSSGSYSTIELKPITGRTHQLRVHLHYLKHPIVGDEFYGGEKADRLMLHAKTLELTLPNRERRIFEAPLPKDFNHYT